MLLDERLEEILLYANMLVETAIEQDSVASMGKLCNDISKYYRALGICGVLLNADTDVFFHGLIQSALTRKYYLNRCVEENVLNNPARKASFVGPFLDAIAANQFRLAVKIASLSPDRWWKGYEYEEDFTYAYFLHKFVYFNDINLGDLRIIFDSFENLLEEQSSERLEICRAFLYSDQAQFEEAFSNLLDSHEKNMEEIADPNLDSILAQEYTFEPNRWIFVEGLAILRIAERLGFQTEKEYKYCPSIARLSDFRPFISDSFPYLAWETEYYH